MPNSNASKEKRNFLYFGIGFALVFAVAIVIPNPTASQQFGLRFGAAIMAAGVGYNISGFLRVSWKQQFPGGEFALKAGGALAIGALIYLVNPPLLASGDTINMTIRASASDQPIVTTGQVTVRAGAYQETKKFDERGEAVFTNVPQKLAGKPMKVLPQVPGYAQDGIDRTIGSAVDIVLQPLRTHLGGILIFSPDIKPSDIRVFADGIEGAVAPSGKFDVQLHTTGPVNLKVLLRNRVVYERTNPISDSVMITINGVDHKSNTSRRTQ